MKLEKPLNILLQRRGAIGDVIMSTGVVRELKTRYGDNANIDVATDFAGIYRNNPHIRNVFPVDQVPAVNNRYDVYINLDDAYELNPTGHYIDNYFYRAFGQTDLDKKTELFPSDEDRTRVLNFAYQNELDKYIVIHMRNWHWTAKNINIDIWFEVFAHLFEERTDFKIVTVGGSTDLFIEDHPLFVDARTQFNDQELKVLCDDAACFVGIDSGPFWAASASKTHIVALLTHLLPARILPYRGFKGSELGCQCTFVQTLEDCRGCNDIQARPVRQLVCSKGNTPCSSNFDSKAIAAAILKQL